MKNYAKEIKIALVAVVGIIVLFFGMNFLKGLTIFSNDNTYYISFKDITGLSGSNPIYANGFKIGVVKDFRYYGPNWYRQTNVYTARQYGRNRERCTRKRASKPQTQPKHNANAAPRRCDSR